MKKEKIIKEKGITMVSLTIVVAVILIITGIIIYNVRDSLKINNLKEMQNDIANLRDKVDEYYAEKGAIPAKVKYTNIEKIKEAGLIDEIIDSGEFYVIDLKNLENVTLNYGEDYRNITENLSQEEVDSYEDIYIINEGSHNIFYVKGIKIDNEWFYTDYTAEDIDNEAIDLRYVEGVKIPEGFYYVGGSKEEGIVISDSKEDLQKGTSHEVAKTLQGNQFVWVPVENEENFKRYEGYYELALQSLIQNYEEPSANGYRTEELEYNEMKQSVLKYKGFYVGRYEAGTDVERTSSSGIEDKVIVKQGANPYNWIGWSNSTDATVETGGAIQKSKEFAEENEYTSVTSTLIYGVQWDAIMQWLDPEYKNGNCDIDTSFVANSTGKGNYNGTLNITGSNSNYITNNIYDLAGNVAEWTMEKWIGGSKRIRRGGNYEDAGNKGAASVRGARDSNQVGEGFGFRIALYITEEKKVDIPEKSTETAFSRNYGVIEIQFLEGTTYKETNTPNVPKMTSDMKAVYWENGVEKVEGESTDFNKNKWYEYIAQSGTTENGGISKWANAKTEDGSYFVWIPRYAYRIVYFDTKEHRDAYRQNNTKTEGIIGYSDARGIVDKNGKTPSDLETPETSIGVGEDLYRPHPAFETDLNQGGWSENLEGIWVSKYDMSQSGSNIKAIPGVKSYVNLSVSEMYTKGYEYDRSKESHLLKNSEWGAMAYLTDSIYGRNGTRVTSDTNSECYTAGESEATVFSNPLQSTTGNEYGIFDTVGGAYNLTPAYIADSSVSSGNSFASTNPNETNSTNNKKQSTKYATVYDMTSSNEPQSNYEQIVNKKFGDAIVETSIEGIGMTSWYETLSVNIGIYNGTNAPFFLRGGWYDVNSAITAFNSNDGKAFGRASFHISLVI